MQCVFYDHCRADVTGLFDQVEVFQVSMLFASSLILNCDGNVSLVAFCYQKIRSTKSAE